MAIQRVTLYLIFLSRFCVIFSEGIDMISQTHPIKDPESIISINKTYELGFFSPVNNTNRYVGIWFGNISVKTIVWVANRDRPLNDSSGIFAISEDGNLVLFNGKNDILWSTNVSNPEKNSTAQLLDSGNLVLFGNPNGSTFWESFQIPTDSLLQNMRLTSDAETNEKTLIKSWKSPSDPTVGSFSAGINPLTVPEFFIWKGNLPYMRGGPWDGQKFIGIQSMQGVYNNGFELVYSDNEQVYLTYDYESEKYLSHYVLSYEGSLLANFWNSNIEDWEITTPFTGKDCDIFGTCGPFGSCNSKDSPICSCLKGYTPKLVDEWDSGNFTSGCVRKVQLQCESDGFLKTTNMKVPYSSNLSFVQEEECRSQCKESCSCIAYSYYVGIGCMTWSDGLIDIQKFSTAGADLYIRLPSSELDRKNLSTVIAISVVVGSILLALCAYFSWLLILKQKGRKKRKTFLMSTNESKLEELPLFTLETLSIATNNFQLKNKLGEGGFGAVYKGKLKDGKEIAVKRLSRSSDQGVEEFMNEVVVISKLQHRNLVGLLGCCIEGEETMLIYEYLPNKSLDAFLFDTHEQEILDWRKRMNIIEGIGRGLLYLHRDSRLRIIHRDLKASNILLDENFNPKISDFGTARIVGGSQNQGKTRRVVGTYGYMAPEYAMKGQFSEKSDVFSFGVLLLEIVSGRRNSSFDYHDKYLSLLQYVWKMWDEDNGLAILDPKIEHKNFEIEILQCIHIGLLCVQEYAADRPSISTVVSMLSNEVASLAKPEHPAFTPINQSQNGFSENDCTITFVVGR